MSVKQLEQKVQQKSSKRDRLKQELDGLVDPKSPKAKRLKGELQAVGADLKDLKDQLKQAKQDARAKPAKA